MLPRDPHGQRLAAGPRAGWVQGERRFAARRHPRAGL
jgi:hypothetical protein